MVEQLTLNQQVVGSNPTGSTNQLWERDMDVVDLVNRIIERAWDAPIVWKGGYYKRYDGVLSGKIRIIVWRTDLTDDNGNLKDSMYGAEIREEYEGRMIYPLTSLVDQDTIKRLYDEIKAGRGDEYWTPERINYLLDQEKYE